MQKQQICKQEELIQHSSQTLKQHSISSDISPSQYHTQYQQFFKDIQIPTVQQIKILIQQQQKLQQNRHQSTSKIRWSDNFVKHLTCSIIQTNFQSIVFEISIGYFVVKITAINMMKDFDFDQADSIGNGSYGSVYGFKSRSKSRSKISYDIAVKVIPVNQSPFSCQYLYDIFKEFVISKICSILQIGPKIINPLLYDIIILPTKVFYCLQLCHQMDFVYQNPQYLQKSTKQLKRSLAILHRLHITHCDIKTQNIMWSICYGKPVFIDFGLSKFVIEDVGNKTFSGFVGTYSQAYQEMKNLFFLKNEKKVDLYYNDVFGLSKTLSQKQVVLPDTLPNADNHQKTNDINDMSRVIKLKYFLYTGQVQNIKEIVLKQQVMLKTFLELLTNPNPPKKQPKAQQLSQQQKQKLIKYLRQQLSNRYFKTCVMDNILHKNQEQVCQFGKSTNFELGYVINFDKAIFIELIQNRYWVIKIFKIIVEEFQEFIDQHTTDVGKESQNKEKQVIQQDNQIKQLESTSLPQKQYKKVRNLQSHQQKVKKQDKIKLIQKIYEAITQIKSQKCIYNEKIRCLCLYFYDKFMEFGYLEGFKYLYLISMQMIDIPFIQVIQEKIIQSETVYSSKKILQLYYYLKYQNSSISKGTNNRLIDILNEINKINEININERNGISKIQNLEQKIILCSLLNISEKLTEFNKLPKDRNKNHQINIFEAICKQCQIIEENIRQKFYLYIILEISILVCQILISFVLKESSSFILQKQQNRQQLSQFRKKVESKIVTIKEQIQLLKNTNNTRNNLFPSLQKYLKSRIIKYKNIKNRTTHLSTSVSTSTINKQFISQISNILQFLFQVYRNNSNKLHGQFFDIFRISFCQHLHISKIYITYYVHNFQFSGLCSEQLQIRIAYFYVIEFYVLLIKEYCQQKLDKKYRYKYKYVYKQKQNNLDDMMQFCRTLITEFSQKLYKRILAYHPQFQSFGKIFYNIITIINNLSNQNYSLALQHLQKLFENLQMKNLSIHQIFLAGILKRVVSAFVGSNKMDMNALTQYVNNKFILNIQSPYLISLFGTIKNLLQNYIQILCNRKNYTAAYKLLCIGLLNQKSIVRLNWEYIQYIYQQIQLGINKYCQMTPISDMMRVFSNDELNFRKINDNIHFGYLVICIFGVIFSKYEYGREQIEQYIKHNHKDIQNILKTINKCLNRMYFEYRINCLHKYYLIHRILKTLKQNTKICENRKYKKLMLSQIRSSSKIKKNNIYKLFPKFKISNNSPVLKYKSAFDAIVKKLLMIDF